MLSPAHLAAKARLIEKIASLGDFAELGGEVFSSGLDTLQLGQLYIMGLNPGGEQEDWTLSIADQVKCWDLEHYSAFLDQC